MTAQLNSFSTSEYPGMHAQFAARSMLLPTPLAHYSAIMLEVVLSYLQTENFIGHSIIFK